MKKKRVVLVFVGLFVIMVGVGGYVLLRFMSTPARASNISAGASTPAQSEQSLSLGSPVQVTGTYADFSYPSIFTAQKLQPPAGNTVAQYSYVHRTLTSWQLTVTLHFLPAGEVDGDSAYYGMSQDPASYSKSTETVNGSPVIIMTNTTSGGYNKTAFLFHDSYSADISLSSEDAQDSSAEQTVLNQVLSSWQWN